MGSLVRPGDVVLHMGRGVQSAIIRMATRSPWSHVSIVTEVVGDRFNVLDVLDRRVVHSIDTHQGEHMWHVRRPRLSPHYWGTPDLKHYESNGLAKAHTRQHVVKHALELHENLPKEYPYVELLAYLPIFRRTRVGRRLLSRTSRLVCSAMVASAWSSMGFKWYNGPKVDEEISPDWVDPGVIWRQANCHHWPLIQTKKGYEHDRHADNL